MSAHAIVLVILELAIEDAGFIGQQRVKRTHLGILPQSVLRAHNFEAEVGSSDGEVFDQAAG